VAKGKHARAWTMTPGGRSSKEAGDRGAEVLCATDHRGVHADHFAGTCHERPARVAGVEGCVGLDAVVDQPASPRAQRSAERRHDAGCDRRLEAERIADRDHEMASAQALGVAQPRRGSAGGQRGAE
jgi:hypothetical protein